MEKSSTLKALLLVGEQQGLIRYRDAPGQKDIQSHFFNLGLYASVFLAPFLLG